MENYGGKACVDCEFHSRRGIDLCSAVDKYFDPVFGEQAQHCVTAREGGKCGPEGKMFRGARHD